MTKEKKSDLQTSYINNTKIVFCITATVMLLFIFLGQFAFPDERDVSPTNCREFISQWHQVLDDGTKTPIDFPGKVDSVRGEYVTLTTTLPDDILTGETICFRSIWQDVEIYINGELRQTYNTKDSRPFGTNSAFRYVFVNLYEADEGKELTYRFCSDSKYSGTTRSCYIGDKMSIWLHVMLQSALKTLITVSLLLMSAFCILICIILRWAYKKTLPLTYLAWALFLCSLWMLSELEFRQVLFRNVSILSNGTYWSLMLMPHTLMIYVNEIQERRYQKVFIPPMIYATVVLITGTLLQVFDIVQFVQQLPFIHAGLIVSIACIIITITVDTFNKKILNYLPVGIGIYGMLVMAIWEMILYYTGSSLTLGTILAFGLVFLLIMAIIKTGLDLFNSEKKKQQAITAREAQAKFLASMSHEIRTPINAVIGMNEMILRENNDATVREYAGSIKSASNMLLGLVNDILDFSKIESGQLQLVEDTYSLVPLIQDELLLLDARANGKPISTNIDIDPYLPSKFWGDELRIKQIITNLLSNAVKYTPEGSVTFKVFFKWIDADNVELCISVIDTGVGIKKEDLAGLFDSFKRLELNKNRNIEGSGLGLNIVQQLVNLMHGTITVESTYGKGSTFNVSIPQKIMDKQPIGRITASLYEHHREEPVHEEYFVAPNAKILVVDDNSMNLSVIKGLLKRTKVQLDLAKSGKECLELTKHKKYHIILMDHMMPDLDGVETLHMLRADVSNPNQHSLVVALTANAVAGCREMYLEYGFNDYISKPIQANKLEALLMQHLPQSFVQKATTEDNSEIISEGSSEAPSEATATDEKTATGDILYIDRSLGMKYAFDSEEIYQSALSAFCEQCEEYLPLLDTQFMNCDWKAYAITTHALKGNALSIGAENFSKLSLQHELAAKQEDSGYILAEYDNYIKTLKQLAKAVEKLLSEVK